MPVSRERIVRAQPEWRRLEPGDDPIVDGFLDTQFDALKGQLELACDWHYRPRRYRLSPDILAEGKQALYTVDAVALERRDPPVRSSRWACAAALVASAIVYGGLVLPALRMLW